ncbi:uncharacterized protein LOC120149327 isoform X1 [Hibiscus syriacus]|uniref:uncharacterized protein LOC120149327 isoform X1 n=1 Tax=Hibiscus syriacus TaxID=106335 RepID=UPI0019214C0F|nr:uncharacterized protein LOC120149327 isoform X1 [Hibiscus syriacus]
MNKYGSTTSDIEFDADAVYLTLTSLVGQTYNAQIMKEWHIHEPKLHYIHRFLAYNYSGRNGTTSCLSKFELFFLWCMLTETKVNLGFWFARAFERVVCSNRPLILNLYITNLAIHVFPLTFDISQFTFVFSMDGLDERCLQTMELLAGNPKAPYFVPPDTITPRGDRVYILRVAPSPPEDSPQPDVQAQINEVYGHLNSIETNIAKILSYLC